MPADLLYGVAIPIILVAMWAGIVLSAWRDDD